MGRKKRNLIKIIPLTKHPYNDISLSEPRIKKNNNNAMRFQVVAI